MLIRDRIKELRRVKAKDIRPNPKNWRTHSDAQKNTLRGVLADIGIADALLAREMPDGSLMLIDGHCRADVDGETEWPVLVLDVTEAEADKLLVTVDPLAAMAGSDAAKFTVRCQLIWKKGSLVIGRGHYHWMHEPLFYAVRQGGSAKWCGDRTQSTIWEIPNMHRTQGNVDDGKTEHGTQKPIECMARPIRNHGDKGDDVYDPFLGSGTTIIAAEQLGRRCYGLEIDPRYCDVIVMRYEKFTGKKAERHPPAQSESPVAVPAVSEPTPSVMDHSSVSR